MDNPNINLPYKLEKFTARNDYAFKKLFGTEANKDIMIEFVSLVTKIDKTEFKDVQIENSELHPKFFDDKAGRLDIKILLQDGRKIDVEMQNIYFDYYAKRSIFYSCGGFNTPTLCVVTKGIKADCNHLMRTTTPMLASGLLIGLNC